MRRRRRYSHDTLRELWARWTRDESLERIAAQLCVSSSGVYSEVRRRGGIPPQPERRRTTALRRDERQVIAWARQAGHGIREIARMLKRAPSTISRELRRNGERTGSTRGYTADTAERRAWAAARRPKRCRLAAHRPLRRVVARKLAARWSPAQIAGWLRRHHPGNLTMQVSGETIYRSLYVQARGALRRELVAQLRRGQPVRHRRGRTGAGGRSQIVGAVSIAARPAEAADRAIPGHWEGDLLAGSQQSHIVTLVERASRFVVLIKVNGKDSATVVQALIRRVRRLPAGLKASLTWDRGGELAQHQRFTVATDVAVYFCDPYSPWQRGTNENTNGLLRQYFPKGTDLSRYTQRQLDAVALQLNARPRQTLGFLTPAEFLADRVATTG